MFPKIKTFIFLFAFVLMGSAVLVFLGYFGQRETVQADSGDNVLGWAWIGADCTDPTEVGCGALTNPIGWISFNDINPEITCAGVSYGVNIDYDAVNPDDSITGSAWVGVGENSDYTDCNATENTIGWLYFDYPGVDWPVGVLPSYDFSAKVVGNEIQGWVPIISKDHNGNQTIVTWVRFKGSNYSTKINSDGTVGTVAGTDHYAWANYGSEGGLGWIDFSPVNGGIQLPLLNQPPVAAISCDNSGCLPTTGCIGYSVNFDSDYNCIMTFQNSSSDPEGSGDIATSRWSMERKSDGVETQFLNCSPGNPFCLWTPQPLSVGIYTVTFTLTDSASHSRSATIDPFIVKQEAESDFMCSFDDISWENCENLEILLGHAVYLKDDPSLANHSSPSQDGSSIDSRVWQCNGVPFDSGNNPHPSITFNVSSIKLIITDNIGRMSSKAYNIVTEMALPEWREASPF